METKQAILPLSAPVSTSILLCFGNRHNHITVFDETIFVSSMTLYQQAVSSYIQRPFLRCKMLVGKSQTLELHPMDAGYAFLQNALSALHRSAQPSRNVMFIGTGIASQQAEHARQIFNAVRVLWPLYAQRHCLQKLNEKAERKYYTVLEFKILMMALAIVVASSSVFCLPKETRIVPRAYSSER